MRRLADAAQETVDRLDILINNEVAIRPTSRTILTPYQPQTSLANIGNEVQTQITAVRLKREQIQLLSYLRSVGFVFLYSK